MAKRKITLPRLALHAFIGLWALTEIFLFAWMAYSSFKTTPEIYRSIWSLPTSLDPINYIQDISGAAPVLIPFGDFLRNSSVIAFVSVAGTILISVPAGYVISKRSRLTDLLFYVFLVMIAVPPAAEIIPVYYLLRDLGLYATYVGIILIYITFNIPFSVVLARAFFKSFPPELEEAAKVDGLGEMGTFVRIVVPLSLVIVIILAIVIFPNVWNELLYAQVMLPTDNVRTIQPGLLLLNSQFKINWGNLFAGMVMSSLPMFVFYVIFQRYIVKAVVVGAVKG